MHDDISAGAGVYYLISLMYPIMQENTGVTRIAIRTVPTRSFGVLFGVFEDRFLFLVLSFFTYSDQPLRNHLLLPAANLCHIQVYNIVDSRKFED